MSALLKNLGVASALAEDVCASGSAPENSAIGPRDLYTTPLETLFTPSLVLL